MSWFAISSERTFSPDRRKFENERKTAVRYCLWIFVSWMEGWNERGGALDKVGISSHGCHACRKTVEVQLLRRPLQFTAGEWNELTIRGS